MSGEVCRDFQTAKGMVSRVALLLAQEALSLLVARVGWTGCQRATCRFMHISGGHVVAPGTSGAAPTCKVTRAVPTALL